MSWLKSVPSSGPVKVIRSSMLVLYAGDRSKASGRSSLI